MSKSELHAFYKGSFPGTATSAEVLSGKTIYLNGVEIVGTMPNNESVNATINAGESYTIPEGYHDGTGTITGNSLASQTSATATASDYAPTPTSFSNKLSVVALKQTAIANISGKGFSKVSGSTVFTASYYRYTFIKKDGTYQTVTSTGAAVNIPTNTLYVIYNFNIGDYNIYLIVFS